MSCSSSLSRYAEASALREQGFTLAAVYLAGYAVECTLKALALSFVAAADQPTVLAEFRGVRAHDYDWLLGLYRRLGGPPLPTDVTAAVTQVGRVWDTAMRYNPSRQIAGVAEVFRAVETILAWSDGRV